jgi:hypothetical protein
LQGFMLGLEAEGDRWSLQSHVWLRSYM